MHILILGGTRFYGRHITEAALSRGHTVTLFNRGKTNPDLFPGVEKIVGDRKESLDMLKGLTWDAVIDVNGYIPRVVRASAQLLKEAARRYVFVSSISVYSEFTRPITSENDPLAITNDPLAEEITNENYGALKALCEQAVTEIFDERATLIRPGYIVGPYDPTDRFTYWPRRVAQGGEMLAPGRPDAPIQFVDGRDLATFAVQLVEEDTPGAFNATGPRDPLTWGAFLERVKAILESNATFTWVDDDFLLKKIDAQELDYNALPIWCPPAEWGLAQTNCAKAIAAGLSFRPMQETVRTLFDWDKQFGTPKCGLSPEKEMALLAEWKSK